MTLEKVPGRFLEICDLQPFATFSKFWSKSGPKKISKKKLFFLAMFKNEITTLKKIYFWNFRFFWNFFFQKNVHNFFHGPIFSWIFFSTVYFFLTRSKTPSYINVWSEEVAEKCTWKSRLRRSSPINTLIKCGKRLQVANLQESTWNFFERHFYTQKNVLNTEPGISDDIAALWKSLINIPNCIVNSCV